MQLETDIPPTIICAENIALLHFLHAVPVPPTARNVREIFDDSAEGSISLDQEREITDILSTLSAIREDVNLVSAVAIREIPEPKSLEILVAVNKIKPSDGNDYLKNIKSALGRVFSILSRATHRENTSFCLSF